MKLNRIAAGTATVATIAIVSVFGLSHNEAAAATQSPRSHTVSSHSANSHSANAHAVAAHSSPAADPSLTWLESRGGQAQVTFNSDVDVLAGDLETENYAPTVANHLTFEADARVVRAEAEKILSTRALLPTYHRAGYKTMLNDFITVANLLQPGPGYGTTAEDYAAWNTALRASNIVVW
jgi:hypothetical protein